MCDMSEKMVRLLERQIELQEEQNELLRENSQLLGEVLSSLDAIGNKEPTVVNVAPGATNLTANHTSVKPLLTEGKERGAAPPPDQKKLDLMMFGTADTAEWEIGTPFEVDHFWPKGKSNPGWVRVSIKHPSEDSLRARVEKGCLCGKAIHLKEANGDAFYSCEGLTQRGGCPYRPAAYFDKLTFLMNLPPAR